MTDDISEKNYYQGGYSKAGVKPDKFREIKSRTTGPDGKIYQGEVGLRLIKKQQDIKKYHERNK